MSGQGQATAILLAAGGSTRLGRPKQLLPWNGSTLLESTIEQLAATDRERLIVVLGGYARDIRKHCVARTDTRLEFVDNVQWRQGQSTSLRADVEHALTMNDTGETIVALCDQPLIGTSHYQDLLANVTRLGFFAAATDYPEGLGVPACFSLPALQSLSISAGDSGARKWLRRQTAQTVGRVTCPTATMDIDTEQDFQERLKYGQVV